MKKERRAARRCYKCLYYLYLNRVAGPECECPAIDGRELNPEPVNPLSNCEHFYPKRHELRCDLGDRTRRSAKLQ